MPILVHSPKKKCTQNKNKLKFAGSAQSAQNKVSGIKWKNRLRFLRSQRSAFFNSRWTFITVRC